MRIVKLGGSLLEWPPCGAALRHWMRSQPSMLNVVLLGGGLRVDALRQRAGAMTEAAAHWEAIRCMENNARQFAAEQGLAMVKDLEHMVKEESRSALVVLTGVETLVRASTLPMDWTVTSDSIAAWITATNGASELVLLKSCAGAGRTALELSADGVVDEYFPTLAERIAFRVVNLRQFV